MPITASIAALPFRLKVATLLKNEYSRSRPLTLEDIEYLDGIPRSIDTEEFGSAGISVESMDNSDSDEESSSSADVLLFRSGDAYLVARVVYPSYCDDESDGELNYLTEVLSFEQARAQVAGEFERLAASLRERVKQCEDNTKTYLARLDALKAEPALVPEVEDGAFSVEASG